MKEPFNNDIFKAWTESQKRIWESLSMNLPNLPSSDGMDTWRKAYLDNLATWEAAVNQTLKAEATWMEQWTQQLNKAESVPQPLAEWTRQMEKIMGHWINTQTRLWEEYFTLLRNGCQVTPPKESAAAADLTPPATADSTPRSPSAATPAKDDLKTINGIGPVLEQKLNAIGMTSYRQIATLTPEDIERIETSVTKLAGRIQRDRWSEQANEQHLQKYGETL